MIFREACYLCASQCHSKTCALFTVVQAWSLLHTTAECCNFAGSVLLSIGQAPSPVEVKLEIIESMFHNQRESLLPRYQP